MEDELETGGIDIGEVLGLYWDCIGIMENEMETTIMGHLLFRV